MTEDEFQTFIADCTSSAQSKNAVLEETFGLGQFVRWHYDGEMGMLTFSSPNSWPIVKARVTNIGSYSLKTKTWMWAWANESATVEQREKSSAIKQLYQRTGIPVFQTPTFECDDIMPWELSAISVEMLEGIGVYRGPIGHLWIFWCIDFVKTVFG